MARTAWYCTAVFLFASQLLSAQGRLGDEGDRSFQAGYYFNAIELYQRAYAEAREAEDKALLLFKRAECHRALGEVEQSELWYDKARKAQFRDPIVYLRLAEAQQEQGKYAEAITAYEKYREKDPGSTTVDMAIAQCRAAQEWKERPTRYSVDPEVFLNTPQYDFGTAFADKRNEDVVFTSSRPAATGTETEAIIGESFFDLFMSRRDKLGKWSEPVKLPPSICTDASESNPVFNSKRTIMYFTRCPHVKNEVHGCDIWMSRKVGNDYSAPVMLPLKPADGEAGGDSATIEVQHPVLSADDATLVFSANLPGGQGGLDLWMIKLDQNGQAVGSPVNLGAEVNTPKHEVFPHLRNNGHLYWSSDGRGGMGGLDIYMAAKTGEGTWGRVENLKSPINSSMDDFGIIFDGDEERGYFSSNRPGGKGQDDIWRFQQPELNFALEGGCFNKTTGAPLAGVTVTLLGTDGSSARKVTDAEGHFDFTINANSRRYILENTSYAIGVERPDVLKLKDALTTVGVEESTTFVREYFMQTIKDTIALPTVLYLTDEYDLTAQAKDSLEYLYRILVDNPTIVIELRSHTDTRPTRRYRGGNMELSQKRAQSCVNYLINKGIDPLRMVPVGLGPTDPLVTDDEIKALADEPARDAAHQRNRRTDFLVLRSDFLPTEQPPPPSTKD
jgi:peptidoglycan-associated lipoprotein